MRETSASPYPSSIGVPFSVARISPGSLKGVDALISMNLIQRSAWLQLRWQQARRHSWERTSEPHRDGSDQPKIGDIAGEAELRRRAEKRLSPEERIEAKVDARQDIVRLRTW